jgi:DNA-binding CsgD family transcriptional regulator
VVEKPIQTILGREAELSRLAAFLDAVSERPAALVLEGEAGIGKTTLWLEGVATARVRSYTVLSSRPADSEARLSLAALSDLMEGVLDDVLADLPAPQRHALEVALLRAEEDDVVDQRTISIAFLGALRILSATAPVLLAIDDVQWLDVSSARVLAFAIRRLRTEPLGLLMTFRASEPGALPFPVEVFSELESERVAMGSLSVGALHSIIASRLGIVLPRRDVDRVHAGCAGNPFYALEIARALGNNRPPGPGEPMRLSSDLQQILATRITALPSASRRALLATAALSNPTRQLVAQIISPQSEATCAIEDALEAGVLEDDGQRLRFTHPLLGSIAYSLAWSEERRRMHRLLGSIVDQPEERARHLALASPGADAEVASALDVAARASRARGAPDAAAELAELAEHLTPEEDVEALGSRAIRAGMYYREAGDPTRARTSLERAIDCLPQGHERASALLLLGYIVMDAWSPADSIPILERAREEAGNDPDLLCDVEQGLAWVMYSSGDCAPAASHAWKAMALAELGSDPMMMYEAIGTVAFQESRLGAGIRTDLFDRAPDLPGDADHARTIRGSRWILGVLHLWAGNLETARSVLEEELAGATARGDQNYLIDVVPYLAEVELRSGDWNAAGRHADDAWAAAAMSPPPSPIGPAAEARVLVDAHLGRVDAVRARTREGVEHADRIGARRWALSMLGMLGFLELSLGDAAEAHRRLGPLIQTARECGIGEPALMPFLPDDVEALVLLGELDEAEAVLLPFERKARALDRAWAMAAAARCRGLICGARGDIPAALSYLDRASDEHVRVGQPFEFGRTLLVKGNVQRRGKQKAQARVFLEEALSIFDGLGAVQWSRKTGAALDRLGRRPASVVELTPTEDRVATLVATGMTNKEVAAALFMAERTVEWNLSKVFRKLQVRSRTELARALPPQ